MECLQGALKTGFGLDMALRNLPLIDDFLGVHGVTDGDDLFVDELLDFSNDLLSSETEQEQQPPQENEPEDKNFMKTCSVQAENSELPVKDEFVPLQETELSIPEEGLESLEWLSHFVEDSFSEYSLTVENRSESVVPVQEPPCFATPVQTKARTKRARTGVRVWPVLSPESSSAPTSSTSSTSSTTTTALFSPPKKQKKMKAFDVAKEPRRCSHCGVTKTPQWRAGPLGSKTLCNACGVRFKSGRLLPEYRPACSPTFSSEFHSNNHRKVLEMRRKKETGTEPAGLTEFLSEVLLN